MLGDLEEEFRARAARDSRRARAWYRRQVLTSLAPNLRRRLGAWTRRGPFGAAARPDTSTDHRERNVNTYFKDVRYAVRSLTRRPAFAGIVVLTLSLGIGATTAIYSAVDGMVLRPFPFPEPERVVGVGTAYPRIGVEMDFWENLSPSEYVDVRENARTLEEVVAWDMGNRQISGTDGAPTNVFSAFWWGDALETTGMAAAVGRGFTEGEIREAAPVAVISHRLWQNRFGGDPAAVGTALHVNGEPYEIVGVLPERFLIYGTDLWIPMPVAPSAYPRDRRQFQIMARLAPGTSLDAANAELETLARRVEAEHAGEFEGYRGWRIEARTWTDVSVANVRPAALILLGAVGFVLLLVCANVANLLLARASSRRREMAVRTAMGAGRGRLLRQLLTESVLLALAGGAVGLGVGVAGIRGLEVAVAGVGLPLPGTIELNARVLLVTACVCVGAGLLFGLAPALHAAGADVRDALQTESRGATAGRARQRLQRAFVGAEVALALALLAGAGLLLNSFVRLQSVDPGFRSEGVLTMRLTLPWERYEADEIPPFFRELTRRVEGLPDVSAAAAGTQFPPRVFARSEFRVEGRPEPTDEAVPTAYTTIVTEGYFDALGIPLLRGRTFELAEDRPDMPPVAVINEAAARRYFPDEDPIGKRIRVGPNPEEEAGNRIVGVVGGTRNRGLDRPPQPEIFALQSQIGGFRNQLFLLVRTGGDPHELLPAIRAEVRGMDPDQPVYAVQTVEEAYAGISSDRRVATVVLGGFALFALLLAALGIYGVVSYAVSQRTQEIGVRIALGADGGSVRRFVVRQAMIPVIVGGAVGVGLALLAGQGLGALLFQVEGSDPATLAGVATILLSVALAASWLPARRASRLDPAEALRPD